MKYTVRDKSYEWCFCGKTVHLVSEVGFEDPGRRKKSPRPGETDELAQSTLLNACQYPTTKCEDGGCSETAYGHDEGDASKFDKMKASHDSKLEEMKTIYMFKVATSFS